MKWLKLLTLYILISSASFIYCESLSRRIKRHPQSDPVNPSHADAVLSEEALDDIFKTKFNYKYVFNWDVGDNSTSEPNDRNIGPRINDDEYDDEQPEFDKGKIILTYPIEELDPPLDNIAPSVQGRINPNNTTPVESSSTEDSNESSEPATDPIDPKEPIECAYNTTRLPIPKPKVEKNGRRIADIKCEEQMLDIKYNIFDVIKNKILCGISGITNGKKSVQKQFPHMGAVGWIDTNNEPMFFCGTSLISSRFSVTAAHCRSVASTRALNVISIYPKLVRFGNVNISDTKDVIDVNIDEFLTLPEFDLNPLMRYNDIALIRFTENIKFSQSVRPACLWHRSMDDLTTGNVTGWGQTVSRDASSTSSHLLFAEVTIWAHDNCSDELITRKNRFFTGLADEQFCAGNLPGDGDTCQGDSGGPLQIQERFTQDESITVFHVVGITSFGFKRDCGQPNNPGIYTKVNKYLSFIERHVWPSN